MIRVRGILLALLVGVVLSGCAPVRIKGDATTMATQRAREDALRGRDHWTLKARLGVSDGHHGGSVGLTWTQDGDHYDFVVRYPITGRSFRLHGGPGGAELDGLDGGPVRGRNAERLLARALGWQVPMGELRDWVRGLRAPGERARLAFGANGLPSLLVQDGWTVQYPDWFTTHAPPMPRKVYAERGSYKVRVAIESWKLR